MGKISLNQQELRTMAEKFNLSVDPEIEKNVRVEVEGWLNGIVDLTNKVTKYQHDEEHLPPGTIFRLEE